MQHAVWVRITHWIHALCFLALVVSGAAILIAHPRFYWGETGYFDTPAAFELPLPLNLDQTGWGRSLHFLAAWITVMNGVFYVIFGCIFRHFWRVLMPNRTRPSQKEPNEQVRHSVSASYGHFQGLTYLGVIFVLLPVMILSGLTLSPAVTAACPGLFVLFQGRQSARTIHFLAAIVLIVFLLVHVAMTILTGFGRNMRAMVMSTTPEMAASQEEA